MGHKFDPGKLERLLRKDRLGAVSPEDVLKEAGLKPGMTAVDIGSGPGFFAAPAARIVGAEGKVYAADTEPEMLKELRSRFPEANIITLESGESSIALPDGTADFVLIAYVLHEAKDKKAFLSEAGRIMKKGARLFILDWEKKAEENGPPAEDRISRDEALSIVKEAGFAATAAPFSSSHYKISAVK